MRSRTILWLLPIAAYLVAPTLILAQATPTPQRIEQMEQELQQMRQSIERLRGTVGAQQDLLRQQEELLQQQERDLQQLRQEAKPPPPAVLAPAPSAPRLPGGLLLNQEMRVEGNFIANKTYGFERDAEAQGFSSDRFSLKTGGSGISGCSRSLCRIRSRV